MIKNLSQITVDQFVAIMEGDISTLLRGDVPISPKKAKAIARKLALEYKSIADPLGMNRYLCRNERKLKAQLEERVLTICENIMRFGKTDAVKDTLAELGIYTDRMPPERVRSAIRLKLAKARDTLKRLESDDEQDEVGDSEVRGESIREMFDSQTAAIMAHFKFQIDTHTMKASVYANLVCQYNAQVKAILARLKGRRGY